MSLITTIEHGIAAGWSKMKVVAQYTETQVLPALKAVQGTEALQETIAVSAGIPMVQQGVRVEEALLAWAINFIETAETAKQDPTKVLGDLVNDIKTVAPAIKAAAIQPLVK